MFVINWASQITYYTHTLHGTGLYAYIDPPGTTPIDRPSYGSPMGRTTLQVLEIPDLVTGISFVALGRGSGNRVTRPSAIKQLHLPLVPSLKTTLRIWSRCFFVSPEDF